MVAGRMVLRVELLHFYSPSPEADKEVVWCQTPKINTNTIFLIILFDTLKPSFGGYHRK